MSETLQDTQNRIIAFIGESFPNADISPGSVLNELLIKLAATVQNPINNDIQTLAQTSNITAALESPTDTYSDIVTGLASNYGVVRNSGNKSLGKVKVTVNSADTLYLQAGFLFTQPVINLDYVTTLNYRITTTPQTTSDIQLTQQSAGSSLYYFVIPVEAVAIGPEYQLTDQTSIDVKVTDSITGFVNAKAYGNFTSGTALETDKELITRFRNGLSNKTLLNKVSMQSKISELYPNLVDLSVVAAADPEMTRSKQNLLGISTLGAVDVYVRTALGLETTTMTKTATKTAEGVWTMSFTHNDTPGFYRVISILPTEQSLTGSLLFTISYDYNNSVFSTTNLVNNKYEGRFSKYQTATAVIQFEEADYGLLSSNIGDSVSFDVLVTNQPNITALQDLFLDPTERILCADYLVKAMLPCFVTVDLKIERKDTYTTFPVDLLKQDIFTYINRLKFGEDIQVSKIIDICHNYNVKKVHLPIKLSGEIYTNHSTTINITSKDSLTIPNNYPMGVSKKTTAFVANYFNTGVDPNTNITDAINIEVL